MHYNQRVRCGFPAHWWKLDEAVGNTTAFDAGYGSAANLTLTGGAAFRGPGAGGGMKLDGSSGFLDFGGDFAFAAVEGITVAAFVRHDSFQEAMGHILCLKDGDVSNRIQLYNLGTNRRARWLIKNNGGTDKLLSFPDTA